MKSTTNLNFLLRYWRLVRPGFRANLLLALWLSASTGSVLAQAVTANGNPAPPLPGASFEAPEVKDCSQTVAPQSWTGQGDIHVLAQQSNCLPLWVPDGKQAVGLEPGASISQTTAWQPGKYQLQFQVALGLDPLVNWFIPPAMTLTVKVGGATVASQVVSSGAFVQVTTAPFTVSSANPVLELSSSCCLPPGSQTSLVGSSHPFTIAIVLDDLSVGSLPVWSNPNSWIGNAVPGLTDSVLIPSSVALELDQSDTVRTIKVEGTLTVAQDRDITLGTDYLWVHGAGALFQWGTETNPYEHQGRLHLMASATDVLPSEIEDFGTNFVGATMGGTLEIHGADRDVAWTFLDATAQENALTITLVEPTDWQVGETLVIASTDYDLDQAEERTITAVSADSTVFTLDAPLDNMHFGEIQTYDHGDTTYYLDTRAEVALLSRNLVILGAEPGPEGFGGQTFIRHGGQGRMSGVQLHHMGQKSELGRYPFHWHHAHDATNQYIKNSTVTYSFNRAVTVHRTMNALIEDVVAHEHIGHGFFLEDATETGNVFNHNLGLGTRAPEEGEEVQLHDRKEEAINGIKLLMLPATFWITNPENTFTNNSSAGSEGSGFWMTAQQGIISGDPIPGFIP
ncbi:MAG: G8 domain-containing protein, partial [Bacteroidota bacterium]